MPRTLTLTSLSSEVGLSRTINCQESKNWKDFISDRCFRSFYRQSNVQSNQKLKNKEKKKLKLKTKKK